jgi:serine/threonine-protein kinase HipA
MCSVLDLEPHDKYTGTIERVARATRALSSAPEEDLLILLRRVLFAWLIADGDMHLKNMALLKTATKGEAVFASVRLAPIYDALTTRVFPGLEHDRMALKLGGKDERLRRSDFIAVASLAGLRATDAGSVIDAVLQRLAVALDAVDLPASVELDDRAKTTIARALEICRGRVAAFD